MNNQTSRQLGLSVVVALMIIASGCQSMRKPTVFSRLAPEEAAEPEYKQPHRMAVIWKETTMPSRPGQKPTRGFGGRVYFYDEADKPVRCEGDLLVYAFNDSSAHDDGTSDAPERKYVFEADDLQNHFSPSAMGPSYSIWIPWDNGIDDKVTVALLPVFKPSDGQIVNAGQSIAILPGRDSDVNRIQFEKSTISEVRQVGVELPIDMKELADSQRRPTTTIEVPKSMAQQLQAAGSFSTQVTDISTGGVAGESADPSDRSAIRAALARRSAMQTNAAVQDSVTADTDTAIADTPFGRTPTTSAPSVQPEHDSGGTTRRPAFGTPGRFR